LSKWQQLDLCFDEGGSIMHETGEIDQFQLLENKVDSLIGLITELKKEKSILAEKVQVQDEKLVDLTEQIQGLNTAREKAKQRIISMLEKIEQIDV
jgi:predicted nuclease with TOPRIM domain